MDARDINGGLVVKEDDTMAKVCAGLTGLNACVGQIASRLGHFCPTMIQVMQMS